jgi:hypothetical protein
LALLKQKSECSIEDIQAWGVLKAGVRLEKGDPLFPKLEEK